MGFAGEAYNDNHVWFVKTHYPLGKEVFFTANKTVFCVRNPADFVPSMFNMWLTQTHSLSIANIDELSKSDRWSQFVKSEITCWRDFHNHWIEKAKTHPVLFFRYEDQITDPGSVLRQVFSFVLDIKPDELDGTVLGAAIERIAERKKGGQTVGQLYKPRSASMNNNLHRYSAEQLSFIKSELSPLLSFFKYNQEPFNFFPDISVEKTFEFEDYQKCNESQIGRMCDSLTRLNGSDPAQGDINVRQAADPNDCGQGLTCRNLWNFNDMIAQVHVSERKD